MSFAKLKAAMLAVKPQPRPVAGPPARKVLGKTSLGSPGPISPSGGMKKLAMGSVQKPNLPPVPPGSPAGAKPGGPPPGPPGSPPEPQNWVNSLFSGGQSDSGGLGGHAGRDLQIAKGVQSPMPPVPPGSPAGATPGGPPPGPPPMETPPSPQAFGASMVGPPPPPEAPQSYGPTPQQRAQLPRMQAGIAASEGDPLTPPTAGGGPSSPGSPYAGLGSADQQFVQSQGDLPGETPEVPPAEPAGAAPSSAGLAASPAAAPPGRFSHVIDTAQKGLPGLQSRLDAATSAGDSYKAKQLQRHIDVANRQIGDLGERQNFGVDEYKQHLAGQGIPGADQKAEQLFEPGGQMDWYQNAANNAATGKADYAGIPSDSPQLTAQLEGSRKMMGSAPPGKTELTNSTPPAALKEAAAFIAGLFPKQAFMYGRTDSTVPQMNQPKTGTRLRERYKRLFKLPLPNEPEKAAGTGCKLTAMLKRRRKKRADAEDPLLYRMMNKGKMDKGKAVAIAKSRGWIRQSGKHLELNKAGRGPRNNAAKHMRQEKASAAESFVAGLFS